MIYRPSIRSALCAAIVMLALLPSAAWLTPASSAQHGAPEALAVHGNSDCDRDVDAVDALATARHTAGLQVTQTQPCLAIGEEFADGPWTRLWADVDCDGAIDAGDVRLVLMYVAGLSSEAERFEASLAPSGPTPTGSAWSCPPIGAIYDG
jgi:hypothetical protein